MEPFLGELRQFSFTFAPRGWALCNGQILSIAQNQALFSLLGTMYGGNGTTNFALPNLQGRSGFHVGDGRSVGTTGGAAAVVLTASQVPESLFQNAEMTTNRGSEGAALALGGAYRPVPDGAGYLGGTYGASQQHENMGPYSVLNWCIALTGIFPSQY